MASAFTKALAAIQGSVKAIAGEAVTYERDGDTVALTAIPGSTLAELDAGDSFTIQTTIKDFLVDTNDLVLSTVQVEPERGDLIIQTEGATVYTFEVSQLGGAAFEYTDSTNARLRIHTTLIQVQ
jgi:hypothetical protein